uniref:HIS3 protein n=1 Tax=Fopius arisanus TaxID=64838 RepID=A0A0C9PNU8_9HYME
MWSEHKRRSRSAIAGKSNLRFVPKTKWDLPRQKSKSYWKNVFEDLDSRHSKKPYCNSQQLRRFLPFKSYNLVAPILGMPEWHPKRWSALKSARSLKALKSKRVTMAMANASSVSVISRQTESADDVDLIVHPPSPRTSLDEDFRKQKKPNPYAAFLSKPRRKAVIWRPLVMRDLEGYDPESALKNRAARVTDKICKDFCDWLRSLGGAHDTIDEDILKDMFETDFTAEACRTMQVCIREMPMVPTVVAAMRHCPESGEPEVTRRQLIRDVRAERKPPKILGFGSTVPHHLRYVPPNNNVHDKWIHCASVPQDLESMSFVWQDITHLDSVRGFSDWLRNQSNVKLPVALLRVKKTKGAKR